MISGDFDFDEDDDCAANEMIDDRNGDQCLRIVSSSIRVTLQRMMRDD
jgi:hypothetical protein